MPRRNDISKICVIGTCLIAIAVMALFPSQAFSCFILPPTVDVANVFEILVADHGKPIPGIPIQLFQMGRDSKTDNKQALISGKSDENGRVLIKGLKAGEYSVESQGAIWVSGFVARVGNPNAKQSKRLVEFQWPWHHIVQAKNLRGRLWSSDPEKPFEALELKVLPVEGKDPLKIQQANTQGRFDFGEMAPGLYVLWMHASQKNVSKDHEPDGPIAVQVAPERESAPEELKLPIGMSSCGIDYAQCSPGRPILLSSRTIVVSDENGGRVSYARFDVQDERGHNIATGRSSKSGVITLPAKLNGRYTLNINSGGFTPLEQAIELDGLHAGAKPLRAVLNVGGTCSTARLEKHATQK